MKESLRRYLLSVRESLRPEEILSRSERIQQRFLSRPWLSSARTIALYNPIRGEVQTGEIAQAAVRMGISVCFPKIVGESLDFSPRPDLIVVPGIAFDASGFRLGFGKGFYDRFLKGFGGPTIGLAYDFQLRDELPRDPWDHPLAAVVSESSIFGGCHER